MKKKLYFGSNLKMYKNIQDTVKYLQDLVSLTKDISREEMELFMEIAGTIDEKMASDETSVPFQELNIALNEAMDPMIVDGSSTAEEVAQNCQTTMTEILESY